MAKKKKPTLDREIVLPEGVSAVFQDDTLTIKGPKGEASKKLSHKKVKVSIDGKSIKISSELMTQREKKLIGSFAAHALNLIRGVENPHLYMLKICSGHFPMNVSVSGDKFIIKNFIGEKVPRTLAIKKGATVKVEGDTITVESPSKEIAGQVSADIEQLTRRVNFDTRIFQDGIYITSKSGKELK